MDIISAKKHLKEKGYCWFNLKDFNQLHYQFVHDHFKCNEKKNLKHLFTGLRANYTIRQSQTYSVFETYPTFEEAEAKQNEIINLCQSDSTSNIAQIWRYGLIGDILQYAGLNNNNEMLKDIYQSITNYLYDIEEEYDNQIDFTYYDIGCRLSNHSDGKTMNRICAILIYFNEKYNYADGGYLILNNDMEIVPEIGNVAVIDLSNFNVPHMVKEVKSGIGRYAALNFCSRKTQQIRNLL